MNKGLHKISIILGIIPRGNVEEKIISEIWHIYRECKENREKILEIAKRIKGFPKDRMYTVSELLEIIFLKIKENDSNPTLGEKDERFHS